MSVFFKPKTHTDTCLNETPFQQKHVTTFTEFNCAEKTKAAMNPRETLERKSFQPTRTEFTEVFRFVRAAWGVA